MIYLASAYGVTVTKLLTFDLLLPEQELMSVQNAVAKKNHNLYYEARLLSPDTQQKAKKVFCYISPKVRLCYLSL